MLIFNTYIIAALILLRIVAPVALWCRGLIFNQVSIWLNTFKNSYRRKLWLHYVHRGYNIRPIGILLHMQISAHWTTGLQQFCKLRLNKKSWNPHFITCVRWPYGRWHLCTYGHNAGTNMLWSYNTAPPYPYNVFTGYHYLTPRAACVSESGQHWFR